MSIDTHHRPIRQLLLDVDQIDALKIPTDEADRARQFAQWRTGARRGEEHIDRAFMIDVSRVASNAARGCRFKREDTAQRQATTKVQST